MRVMLLVLVVLSAPAWAGRSQKEMTEHRKDCLFKGDGHYDRHNVSCAPPALVKKQKAQKGKPLKGG